MHCSSGNTFWPGDLIQKRSREKLKKKKENSMSKYLENDVVAASLCILHKEYYAVCRKLAREGGCCRCCLIQRQFG
jgi:hypothetical protein